jgi:hypothetical protein
MFLDFFSLVSNQFHNKSIHEITFEVEFHFIAKPSEHSSRQQHDQDQTESTQNYSTHLPGNKEIFETISLPR